MGGAAWYPWMLVDEVTIDQAAAPSVTLWALLIAFAGAALLVVPLMVPFRGLKRESGAGPQGSNSGAAPATVIGERFANTCHWMRPGR